jgi:uncharacterized protein involved in outer membrane biogenesis
MMRKLLFGVAFLLLLGTLATVAVRLWLRSDAVRATVESQATAALGMPVRIGGARATVFPRLGLDLENVQIGNPSRASVDRIAIATGFGLLVSRRVEGADVQMSGGYLDASFLAGLASPGPGPASAADGAPATGAPFVIVSVRSIRLRNVDLVVGAERIPTSLDASLGSDRLDVSSLTAQMGTATLHVDGRMSSLSRREGHFDVRSDALPIDALLAVLSALSVASPSRDASSPPLRITATISAPSATLGNSRVESFQARLQTTKAGIVFDPLGFQIDKGRFEAWMSVDISAKRPIVSARGNVSGVDVTKLQDSSQGGGAIAGRLDARFTLNAPVQTSISALIGVARGPIEMEIRDGRMPGIEVIRQAVIRYANRNQAAVPAKTTDAFTLLSASLTLQSGSAGISALAMNTPDFDLTGSGELALSSGRLALDVDVILSEELSQQAGRDLYRYARHDKRIILPAIIGGTLSKPTAAIDIGEATGRALKNRIEDEAKSILDRAIKGMKR